MASIYVEPNMYWQILLWRLILSGYFYIDLYVQTTSYIEPSIAATIFYR